MRVHNKETTSSFFSYDFFKVTELEYDAFAFDIYLDTNTLITWYT